MITDAAKNEAADGVVIDTIKLHSGDPGAAGTTNEISGASSAITLAAASGGVREMASPLDISVPASTVSHYSLWGSATLKSTRAFDTPEVYAGAGTATVSTATFTGA